MTDLSPAQAIALAHLAAAGRLVRFPGGYWGATDDVPGASGAPSWFTGIATLRVLEARGLVVREAGPEWGAPRIPTAEGLSAGSSARGPGDAPPRTAPDPCAVPRQ